MKILAVRLADLGDALLATPALRALRRGHPEAEITALLTPIGGAALGGHPALDRVIISRGLRTTPVWRALSPGAVFKDLRVLRNLRHEGFDLVAIFHHLTTRLGALKYALIALGLGAPRSAGLDNGRGWFLTHQVPDLGFGIKHEAEYALHLATLLGGQPDGRGPDIALSPTDRSFAETRLHREDGGPLVALHPGSGGYSLARRWPVEGFAQVARALARSNGATFVIVGGTQETQLAHRLQSILPDDRVINLAGATTVKQLAAVLERCDLFVGNDSGVMHTATAVRTPVVAVFGPSNDHAWGPYQGPAEAPRRNRVVRVNTHCSPCLYVEHRVGERRACPDRLCWQRLEPGAVIAACQELLEQHAGERDRSGTAHT